MRSHVIGQWLLALNFALAAPGLLLAQEKSARELIGDVKVENVQTGGPTQVPVILWGGEAATFLANGGTTTSKDSIYGKLGLNLKLTPGDDSIQQARDYLSGKSPYYRGTFRMACLFAEVFNQDPRTRPVMILQLTFSKGDHIVAREAIKSLNDLKGKKVCLQQGGPHLGLLEDSLKAAGLTWKDITVVWTKDLTGPEGPAEMMRKDKSIDAACVVTPDMIGLCSGIKQVGSGAEGTIKGAHVVNSTAYATRSIADVYVVRDDYFKSHKDQVEKFVIGYFKGTEELLKAQKAYNDGKGSSPGYVKVMNQMQQFYGKEVLPTIEEDVHGLILDATFVRVPGNELFFNVPNNLAGFQVKQTSGLALAVNLGYAKEKVGFATAGWDYKDLSSKADLEYIPPTPLSGGGEAAGDLNIDDTILSFEIRFQPNQIDFPPETYAMDFKRFCETQATFGNAAIVIEGHADTTLAVANFFWAARAKGLITGESGNYKFKGKPLKLTDTAEIIQAIQSENLAGQQRRNNRGQIVPVDDPKRTVAAALTLSQSRAERVKEAIEKYAKDHGYKINLKAVLPQGIGIAKPVNALPRNSEQRAENRRVLFRVVKTQAELTGGDFPFDEK